MKRINRLLTIIIILVFISGSLYAQDEYRIKLDNSKSGKISISNVIGSLTIKSHRGQDIIVKYSKKEIEKEMKKHPDRAKGLKPITHEYEDDTGLGFSVNQEKNEINIIGSPFRLFSGISEDEKDNPEVPKYEFMIPEDIDITVNGGQFIFYPDNEKTKLVIEDIHSEITVNAFGGGVLIKNITGPATIHSISGTTVVIYSDVDQENPISITSSNGDIDLTLPRNTPADLNFNAIMGEVFSDFDIEMKGKKKEPKYDLPLISTESIGLHGKINGGGVKINLTAITGNIYLRKK